MELGLPLHNLKADCSAVGSGLMCNGASAAVAPAEEWWPFRNQLLVTLAAAWGTRHDVSEIMLGSVKSDGERQIDGSRAFYQTLDQLISMQEGKINVVTPAIELTSIDLIRESGLDGKILGWTHSCHTSEWACGTCPGCRRHEEIISAVLQRA